MKFLPKNTFLFIFLLFYGVSFSQILEGTILDKNTSKPIASATVYLDGTTISTLTDENGVFTINSRGNTKPDLVISYLGYVTTRVNNPFQYKKIKALLEEDSIAINEVFIGKGPFTQKQMMKAFRYHFLGNSEAGSSCKILNEDDLYFFFDVETNVLSATAQSPLKIVNKHLGYEVNFDLVDFEVKFEARTLNPFSAKSSLFSGTTFFTEIAQGKKVDHRRINAYLGSSTHFMKTVANNSWEKDVYKLYVDKFPADPKEYFKVTDTLGLKKIKILKDPMKRVQKVNISKGLNEITAEKGKFEQKKDFFIVMYQGELQSAVDFSAKEFLVDQNGNYSPFYGVVFGGYIGSLKAGDMLPADYFQNLKTTP